MAAAATVLQSAFRMHRDLKRYRKIRDAAMRIQANIIGKKLRKQFIFVR